MHGMNADKVALLFSFSMHGMNAEKDAFAFPVFFPF